VSAQIGGAGVGCHDRAVLLKACVNGPRRPAEHPALPITPGELAADVAAVTRAGVGAVHLHVKDAAGVDTFAAAELSAVLEAVRGAAPALPVGVTTGAWALPDPGDRVLAVQSWMALPDFASVNWHEDGADQVAEALLAHGVGVEVGLWHTDAVEAWLASPHRDRCLRVLIELPDGLDDAETQAEAARLLKLVRTSVDGHPGAQLPVLLHGEGSSCWPALETAARLRLDTRIGLEDTLELPDGSPAADNAALVATAQQVIATAMTAR
jgi:uncharacterized protein (DUF849 family)